MNRQEVGEVLGGLNLEIQKDMTTYAIILFLLDTGVEKNSALMTQYRDLEFMNDTVKVNFTGRYGARYNTYMQKETYRYCVDAFKMGFKRDYIPTDYLFYSSESYHGKPLSPMKSGTLHARMKDLSARCGIKVTPRQIRDVALYNGITKNAGIDKQGYIYFIIDDVNMVTCIGETSNIKNRIPHYRIHSPIKLNKIWWWKVSDRKAEEGKWHKKYNNYKSHYGWYKIGVQELNEIRSYYDNT